MSKGRYGVHGGQYIPETLMNEIINLENAYEHYKNDPEFVSELDTLFREYANRPDGVFGYSACIIFRNGVGST